MKRKRGNKKGKAKAKHKCPSPPPPPPAAAAAALAANEAAVNLVSLTREDDISGGGDEYDDNTIDNDEFDSRMEVDTPSSTGTDQPLNVASIKPDGSIDKGAGKLVGRVKVKLKTSKKIESQSDTDKSSPLLGLEQQGTVCDKVEDSGNSLPDVKMGVSGSVEKKPGSIKIKSSKMLGGLGGEKSSDAPVARDDSSLIKEQGVSDHVSLYNKQELDSALSVIKKVMKMDAAEPFNVPVNPEALGIPDYFEVIDTPMDFGTICSNIEKGDKYMNSEDVYKDVQYIWDNCFKYNSKGDYILDLMKRVKKNFVKNWTAAGLYTEQSKGPNGAEGFQGEDAAVSSQMHVKSGQIKQKAKKRGRRHKMDCLCAICVLKRRRREREENARLAKGVSGVTNNKLSQQFKQEDSSLVESPHGGDSSSNMGESLDPDAGIEVEGKEHEVKADITEGQYSSVEEKCDEEVEEEEEEDEEEENEVENEKRGMDEKSMQSQYADTAAEEPIGQSQPGIAEHVGATVQTHIQEVPYKEETLAVQQHKLKEVQERQQRAKKLENFQFENPMLLSLCRTLFPDNRRSVWGGPHSLVHCQGNARRSSIHAAIETLMK